MIENTKQKIGEIFKHALQNLPLTIILIAFIIPSMLYLTQPNFIEYDSYYFLNIICNPETPHHYSFTPDAIIQDYLFAILPCNNFILKIIIITLLALNLLIIYLIGEETKKGTGHLTILFATFTPILITNSFKFENDIFGYPLIFTSLYFFIKHLKEKKEGKIPFFLILSIGVLGIGSLLWGGGIYYLLAFSLSEPLLLLIIAPILYIFFDTILKNIIPNFHITENSPITGLNFFILYGIWWIQEKWFLKGKYPYLFTSIPLMLFALINPKFFILALPFFALTMVNFYEDLQPNSQKGLIAFAIVLTLFSSIGFLPIEYTQYPPKNYEHQAVKDLIQTTQDYNKQLVNDWQLGHMIWYYNGETQIHSGEGSPGQWNVTGRTNAIVLTRHTPDENRNCQILKQYDQNPLGYSLRLWNC